MKLTPSPFAPAHFPDLPRVAGVRSAAGSRGFYAKSGIQRDDVFLMVFDAATTCAGVFTRSTTASADVDWCRQALVAGGGKARALVVNSGNSNAFTGPRGVLKNDATLAAMRDALGVERGTCFLAATGVIGEPLDDANYVGAIVPELAAKLAPVDWQACARAFMTTDTFAKGAGRTVDLDGVTANIAGIVKGSGMIAPNMATMLAYIATDAAVAPDVLDTLVREVADVTFNAVTVDNDTSTSDTFMVFATGASGAPMISDMGDPRVTALREGLLRVALKLAHQLVKDGEGAQKFISIRVTGAVSDASAKILAAAVANSPLVKTALAAGDANWGRVVMALGKSLEPIDQSALSIWFGDHQLAEHGGRTPDYDEARASEICAAREIDIHADVGVGEGESVVYTCDLTHAYIDINGAYRT